ncbi:MAG: endonuclease/exonuclease/phosphatase family protein [Pirellulaceae bacterium]
MSRISLLVTLLLCSQVVAQEPLVPPKSLESLRVATFNVSLNRPAAGRLAGDLKADDAQARAIATVIRAIQPDLLLLNEIDYDSQHDNAARLAKDYLADPRMDALGGQAWEMPHIYTGPVNTGLLSDVDVNQDGKIQLPEDGWGFGRFPGQYGMAVMSRYQIDARQVVDLQELLWSKMPGALRPQQESGLPYYDDATWGKLRIASKSFWDVPVLTPLGTIHLLASHPTPPAFDGPEDRNGCRNHDEIRLIEMYIDAGISVAEEGKLGLASDDAFVVVGDLNSDPVDGASRSEAIRSLLEHPRIARSPAPRSAGGANAARVQRGVNTKQAGDPATDTADFNDRSVGNLRVDYVLPSQQFTVLQSGVFWPDLERVAASYRDAVQIALAASDHHCVWVDIAK